MSMWAGGHLAGLGILPDGVVLNRTRAGNPPGAKLRTAG